LNEGCGLGHAVCCSICLVIPLEYHYASMGRKVFELGVCT
jgi:hypothetical protein